MLELKKIEYARRQLVKAKHEGNLEITTVIGMGQKVCLEESVIEEWKLKEDLEGIFTMTFKFHRATKMHNMSCNYSHYQVQRNASGAPILVRVLE